MLRLPDAACPNALGFPLFLRTGFLPSKASTGEWTAGYPTSGILSELTKPWNATSYRERERAGAPPNPPACLCPMHLAATH
jgi:hypothetical protein